MKGIVFTEFLEFVGSSRGEDFVDDMIAEAGLAESAYTSVGTYDFNELSRLLGAYCSLTGESSSRALNGLGRHLCGVFQKKFPEVFGSCGGLLDFLRSVDGHIHVEVRKLYADAELPRFEEIESGPKQLVLDYISCRPLADLAIGLIEGASEYYREKVAIVVRPVVADAGVRQRFEISVC
ncbi:heme NO-binding domain-containing protein [Methylocystis heyeri]|uniref:Heme NO-binding domain-containing protein n=1 Tax=Methylocystis heyeri TaxID=391905 RepID=A0A6B8K8U3_9HYPH|nr:heme NO-binding domain-containing protein [Methylocystis heyeri]QGM44466.1 hypothetical protein H2LOC_001440 [Methylocystis heyeri]